MFQSLQQGAGGWVVPPDGCVSGPSYSGRRQVLEESNKTEESNKAEQVCLARGTVDALGEQELCPSTCQEEAAGTPSTVAREGGAWL